MIKPKYKKAPNDIERAIYNYDWRRYHNKQAEFERRSVLNCSRLGFTDIETATESVIDRLDARVNGNKSSRPTLYREDNEL